MPDYPYVIVNVAQSLNGFIAGRDGERTRISSDEDLERVHNLRSSVDAVLVGANTVIKDNPDLKVRNKGGMPGKQPLRVVLDSRLTIQDSSRILDGTVRTLVFTENAERAVPNAEKVMFAKGTMTVSNILTKLGSLGVKRVLVEGGRSVINQFISSGFINEFYIYIGDIIIGGEGIPLFDLGKNIRQVIKESIPLGNGILVSLQVEKLLEEWK